LACAVAALCASIACRNFRSRRLTASAILQLRQFALKRLDLLVHFGVTQGVDELPAQHGQTVPGAVVDGAPANLVYRRCQEGRDVLHRLQRHLVR
jgi:hypothetical protein